MKYRFGNEREVKMLSRIFNYNNPVFRFFIKVGYIWWLNILWLICSIPIFTIGASTTALVYSCMKLQTDSGYVTENFFKSFKENFKQATGIWMIYLIIGVALIGDLIYWNLTDHSSLKLVWAVTIALLIPYCYSLLYVFAIQSKFVNTVKNTIHFALVLPLKHLKYTFPMLVIVGIVVYLNAVTIVMVNFVTMNIGVGIVVYLLSFYYRKVFSFYIKEEPEEVEGIDGEEHR